MQSDMRPRQRRASRQQQDNGKQGNRNGPFSSRNHRHAGSIAYCEGVQRRCVRCPARFTDNEIAKPVIQSTARQMHRLL